MTDAQVDWQQQVAEYASKSPKHSEVVDEVAHRLLGNQHGEDYWEVVYTLAVQRFQMQSAGALEDGEASG